jgi:HlyD family secretion protein
MSTKAIKIIAVVIAVVALSLTAVVLARTVLRRSEPAAPEAQYTLLEGTLEAPEVDVSSKIPGRLSALMVDEGDPVSAGQVIATLESKEVDAKVTQATGMLGAARAVHDQAGTAVDLQSLSTDDQIRQAQAGLAASKAKLEMALNGPKSSQIAQVQAAVNQAREAYQTATKAHDQQVKQAEAGLAAAKAKLEMALKGARPQEIEQAEKAVEAARAAYDTAQSTYERFHGLFQEGVIPQQKDDEIRYQYLAAKAQKEAAEAKLSLVREGARKEDIDQARAGVDAAQAQLRMAQESRLHLAAQAQVDQAEAKLREVLEGARPEEIKQARAGVSASEAQLKLARDAALQVQIRRKDQEAARMKAEAAKGQVDEAQAYQSETQIIAPISGFISEKMTNPGEIISAGFPLFTIVKAQDFKVKVYADESKFGFLRLNQPVKIVLPALANAEVDGQILRVSQAADFATKKATNEQGTFDVRAMEVVVKVLSQDPRLRNGMTARVKIPTTTSRP